ncbi:MAG: hypothetical protein RMJ59_05995 [Candidatus Nitrosocaldus sp.]|nr:hypothetical protein [Candidatus Nitrosocaldus sp.]MDW8275915.1 hypothetical protein [Candidatus Nitrosocaldus sp.]
MYTWHSPIAGALILAGAPLPYLIWYWYMPAGMMMIMQGRGMMGMTVVLVLSRWLSGQQGMGAPTKWVG